jgi:hypothetical protein
VNITLILIGFSLAVLMGAGLASLFRRVKPEWSIRRRQLTAASVLPAVTLVATLLGIVLISLTDHGEAESMESLAIAAVATVGGGFVVIALIGGLIGATLSGRRHG